MSEETMFNAETVDGWLVEPMVSFKINIYPDKTKRTDKKEKVITMDFLGLYFREDGDSMPSLRIMMNSEEAKRFADKILQIIREH